MKGCIAMLLDETGSMKPHKPDVLEAVNTYIESMRDLGDEVAFILTKFNAIKLDTLEPVPISGAPLLEAEHYEPNYGTPLFDAVFQTIEATKKRGYDQVFFVIQTDGEENASKHTNAEQVKAAIDAQKAAGWEFVYLGEGVDAWGVGGQLGTQSSYDYQPTRASRMQTYAAVGQDTRKYFR